MLQGLTHVVSVALRTPARLFTHPARLLDASAAATAIWHAISMTLRTGANAFTLGTIPHVVQRRRIAVEDSQIEKAEGIH